MRRTFKYRLYPNRRQAQALDFLLWQGRRLYNAALEQRITTYQETKKGLSFPAQWAHFRDMRRTDPEGLGKLNATCVQQTLRRLDKAFAAFFRRIKAGETPGFPRFKGRGRFHYERTSIPQPSRRRAAAAGRGHRRLQPHRLCVAARRGRGFV